MFLAKCEHCFHQNCLDDYFSAGTQTSQGVDKACPLCRTEVSGGGEDLVSLAVNGSGSGDKQSSKLKAIFSEMDRIIRKEKGAKILLFSQFMGFLDMVETGLETRKIATYRIDGSKNMDSRQQAVKDFGAIEDSAVMVISMKAGGVGINLMAATKVFICDPWWNGAIEDQCIARCHRIGQDSPVDVYKFIVDDSVEVGINKIQQNKRALAGEILEVGLGWLLLGQD